MRLLVLAVSIFLAILGARVSHAQESDAEEVSTELSAAVILQAQTVSIGKMIDLADADSNGSLAGDEIGQLAVSLESDPMIREGLAHLLPAKPDMTPIEDLTALDSDGDGILVLETFPLHSRAPLERWDFDGDGRLELEKLRRFSDLLERQTFVNGQRKRLTGEAEKYQSALSSPDVDDELKEAGDYAVEAYELAQLSFHRVQHESFFAALEEQLGAEYYNTFIEKFSDTLVTSPLPYDLSAVSAVISSVQKMLLDYDTNGNAELEGKELTAVTDYWAGVRVENAAERVSFWQANLNWVDQNGDHTLVPSDVPFLTEDFFLRFDLDTDGRVGPEEFKAIRDDQMARYLARRLQVRTYGYATMLPIFEEMGAADEFYDLCVTWLEEYNAAYNKHRNNTERKLIAEFQKAFKKKGIVPEGVEVAIDQGQLTSQMVMLAKLAKPADTNSDGRYAGDELYALAEILENDPVIRTSFIGVVRDRLDGNPMDDVMLLDLDGDGIVNLVDAEGEMLEILELWDFDGSGDLGFQELEQLEDLIRVQAFSTGQEGGKDRGLGDFRKAVEVLSLPEDTLVEAQKSMDADEARIANFHKNSHQTVMGMIKERLTPEEYRIFVDKFSETLITRPDPIDANAVNVSITSIHENLQGFDKDGERGLTGEEFSTAMQHWAKVRIENEPRSPKFWQTNLNWLDQDGDRQLAPADIPFLADQFFVQFDSNTDGQIDTSEFKAIRDDLMGKYMDRQVPLREYSYATMLPVMEQMGVATEHRVALNEMIADQKQKLKQTQLDSREVMVAEFERILGYEVYEEFRIALASID